MQVLAKYAITYLHIIGIPNYRKSFPLES